MILILISIPEFHHSVGLLLILNSNTRNRLIYILFLYGAKRIRTADPLNAIEVLYQLSYNPLPRYP